MIKSFICKIGIHHWKTKPVIVKYCGKEIKTWWHFCAQCGLIQDDFYKPVKLRENYEEYAPGKFQEKK